MNWKSPSELRWQAEILRGVADELIAAALQLEVLQATIRKDPEPGAIEEGDRVNG